METTSKLRPDGALPGSKRRRRFFLPIGFRLFFAFLIIILLTGLIGFLAVQRLSDLTKDTTELNTQDLPEVALLGRLHTLVIQQDYLEQLLVTTSVPRQPGLHIVYVMKAVSHCVSTSSGGSEGENIGSKDGGNVSSQQCVTINVPVPVKVTTPAKNSSAADFDQHDIAKVLTSTLANIVTQRSHLIQLEPLDATGPGINDSSLVTKIIHELAQTNALSQQLQKLLNSNTYTHATVFLQNQLQPLLQTTLVDTSHLRSLEQYEATTVAAHAQQQSGMATTLIFVLTALALLLSILLAMLITRSLTKPLSQLLFLTGAIAQGNLDVEPHIAQRDELGQLAAAFDIMRRNLRSNIAKLAAEQEQTRAIIDASADGVMLVDERGTILQFNPAAERLSSWHADEAIGKPCWEVFGIDERASEEMEGHDCLYPLKQVLQEGTEQSTGEIDVLLRDGERRWFTVSVAHVLSPRDVTEQQCMVVGIHDISQLKAVEQLKSDFVTMVSHELRAPLTTVTGAVEMLGMLDPASDDAAYHEVLGILDQQTQRLRQVVEEVLQLTRFDAGRLRVYLQPLSVSEFFHTQVEQIHADWASLDRPLNLRLPVDDVLIWGDRDLLEIVMRNLLENAHKYTPHGSPIEVEIEVLSATQQVQVRVLDHGSGIPAEQLPHIFDRFSRGSQTSYDWSRGYGLGLYIVRELLKAHNGDIWVENTPEGGACFVLTLCIVEEDAERLSLNESEYQTGDENTRPYDPGRRVMK